jgi:hypothetical protein
MHGPESSNRRVDLGRHPVRSKEGQTRNTAAIPADTRTDG